MNRFEFNTDLMSLDKYTVFSNEGFNVIGLSIRFTNEEYFKQCLPIFKQLGNQNFKIMIVNPQTLTKQTFVLEVVSILGIDIPNNTLENNLNINTFRIQGLLRCQSGNFPSMNNLWMYILYE